MKQLISFFVLLMLFFAALSCGNNPPKNSLEGQAQRGKVHYQTHCMGCHGPDGKGGGMITQEDSPSNLTTIMARWEMEEFPIMRVARLIDGRDRVEAHGTATMPIWGEVFASGELLDEEQIEGKLEEIIAYLITIQVPES